MAEKFELREMEQETERMLRIRCLNGENAVFARTPGGFVSLRVEGEFYPRVQVVRMFPFMEKEKLISIRTVDENSTEIGIVEDLHALDRESAAMLREQLELRYFTPCITNIRKIREEYGFAYWEVLTDRGECRFTIRMGGSAVVYLTDTRVLISDVDENRFEIPDINALTPGERKKLDLYL